MLFLYFIFAIRKIRQMLWKIFLIPPLYNFEKKIHVNKHKKINLSLFFFFFFWRHDKWPCKKTFSAKVCHFQYDYRFIFRRETGNIRAYREVRLKMKNHLGSIFRSHFLQNILIETSNLSYFVLCNFLISWSLKI